MGAEHVLYKVEDGIAVITLSKPERLNAVDPDMRAEIGKCIDKAAEDESVRVLVITGEGKAFCAGGDVKTMEGRLEKTIVERRESLRASNRVIKKIRDLDKPVIAAVNGDAVGAGCNLALACDIRLASDKARFGEVFVKRGLHPDWGGTYNLTRLVGTAKACELIFTGDLIDAEEALRIGIVNRVIADDEFEAAWKEFAKKLAGNAPIPIRLAKAAIYKADNVDIETAMDLEAFSQAVASQTEDAKEGVKAFMEKRKPEFKGK
jgi:2-(1,2-epoxy-1,2-dihydrophenyl)acetyl-CoA isomerase